MQIVTTRKKMSEIVADFHVRGKTIGFVPTMGYLHEGHLSLVKRAKAENDVVIVSIFVNPTQFSLSEDFASYPCDLERDKVLLGNFADYVFSPDQKEIYHGDEQVNFDFKDIANCLCGVSRPHHFKGVATVVMKLFNIVKPYSAYFGQKDYQQTILIKRLIKDLFLDIDLVVCPIVRETDGLAMSSRNIFLSQEERKQATVLRQSLRLAQEMFERGEKNCELIIQKMREFIQVQPLARIDYIDIREAENLQKVSSLNGPVIVALAVFFGKTRLIDNYLFTPVGYATER